MSKTSHALSVGGRGISNAIRNRVYSISFEVTRSCNARCKHCHLRGAIPDEVRATADDYAQRCRELKPVVAMVSGGEPLLRKDLEEIIEALKKKGKAVYITMTTNGALFTKQKYDSLRAAGVDLFSLSLDYPDERHDDFRGIPELFKKIVRLLEETQHLEDKAITFSCVVQRDNYRDLPRMAEFAQKWGVKLNLSTYTWLRTKKREYLIPEDEIEELEDIIDILREHKKKHNAVIASEYTFKKMMKYFKKLSVGNCRAGEKFLIVNPDATLSPCGLHIGNYTSQKEIIEDFLEHNSCSNCMTSIRANTEKSFKYQVIDALRASRRSH